MNAGRTPPRPPPHGKVFGQHPLVRGIGLTAALALGVAVAATSGCALNRLSIGREMAAQAVPYQAQPAQPSFRLLVVGDSTAVGTGASSPEHSLPGLIGQDQPGWQIRNLARNGALFADVAQQLATAEGGYDAVLVLAGGNDVMRLTDQGALRANIEQVARLAATRGRSVVLMPCGNVGHAPFFLPPLSWWMDQRSQVLHAEVAAVARANGAHYVRLLLPKDQDPFVAEPDRLNAADGLHPSNDGYAHWYQTLVQQGGLPLATAADAPPAVMARREPGRFTPRVGDRRRTQAI